MMEQKTGRRGSDYRAKVTSEEKILEKIKPGQKIFVSSGVAAPGKMLTAIARSDAPNIRDLECRGTAPCLSQTQHPDLSRYSFTVRNGNNEMKLHKFAHEIGLVFPEEGAPKG